MTGFVPYVKAFICKCECGWSIDKEQPETCWNCGSTGPHLVSATSQSVPSFMMIAGQDEDYLFSTLNEVPIDD